MKTTFARMITLLGLAAALTCLVTYPALANKPSWAGGKGKSGKHERSVSHEQEGSEGYYQTQSGSGLSVHVFFNTERQNRVRSYYTEQYRSGHCPPGLAKKNNGCMPPGQAKKWQVGRPLPNDVVSYGLPQEVVVELGPPPPHHRFVRVASDILLIAEGTGMIVDAIEDLGNMH